MYCNPNILDETICLKWAESKKVYCVLDAAVSPELPKNIWLLGSSDIQAASLLDDSVEAGYMKVAPFLVSLNKRDDFYFYLTNLCMQAPIGIFLISAGSWKEAFEEAKNWLWPKKQNGEQVYFRYYDPRVFSSLVHYASMAKAHLATGTFLEVFGYDIFLEELFHFKTPYSMKKFSLHDPWLLDPDMEEWLMESQLPHRIMDMLKNCDPQLCKKYSDFKLFQKIKQHLIEASSYNILELKDLLRFNHLSFLFPGFTANENIRASLVEFRRSKTSFNKLVASWPYSWLTPYRQPR